MTKACYRFQNRNHKQWLLYYQPKQCSITEILQNYQQHFGIKFDPLGNKHAEKKMYFYLGFIEDSHPIKSWARRPALKPRGFPCSDQDNHFQPHHFTPSANSTCKFPTKKKKKQLSFWEMDGFLPHSWTFLKQTFSPWMGFRRLSPIIKMPPKKRTRKSLCPRY